MRSIPFYPMMVLLLIGLGGYLGCEPGSLQLPPGADITEASGNTANYTAVVPTRSASRLLIGSFNVQRLGPSKLGKPDIMEKLAAIIRQFDVIAIQEITSKDQRTLPILVDLVNRSGGQYDFVISERIGRAASGYYEQYAFVFDTARINGGKEYCYVVQDERDLLHREPFVGRFQTKGSSPFGFTLINMHTDPDEIKYELDVLADVYGAVRQFEYPEDDVILLGDLNAGPGKLQKLEAIPGFMPLISGIPTNTRQSRTLDNIMIDTQNTREFSGRAGTINLEQMFSLQLEDAEDISDHLPVWAEFTFDEVPTSVSAMAGAGGATRR
ncbi:MAG: endonuclease/exonuclease/phosphatase family protein [Aureliella sp.]